MLVDIFSSFDPSTSLIFTVSPLFWIPLITIWMIFLSSVWVSPTPLASTITLPISFIADQLNRGKSLHLKGLMKMLSPMFLMVILMNLTGLIPYIFSTSSHLLMTLVLGLPLWLSLLLSSAVNSPSQFSANLLPSGAPSWLSPALILIETISILVRPITLSFRLAANMSAGHIVLGLVNFYLAAALSTVMSSSFLILLFISTGYTLFEVGICLVQAYIFCLLISLYADEHSD